jgi:hypothetical protein
MTNALAHLFHGRTHRISHASHERILLLDIANAASGVRPYNGKGPLRTPSFLQHSPHQLWEALVPEVQDRCRRCC